MKVCLKKIILCVITVLKFHNPKLIDQGDDVWDKAPVSYKRRRDLRESDVTRGHQKLYDYSKSIYTCALDEPPSRVTADVKATSTMRTTFDVTSLPKLTGQDGTPFQQIPYTIEVNVVGGVLEFDIKYQGKVMAHQNVEMDLGGKNTSSRWDFST